MSEFMTNALRDTPVAVRSRGKAFIAIDLLPVVTLPARMGAFTVPVLVYEGNVYIPAEHATWMAIRPPLHPRVEPVVCPTLETVRVTAGKHKFSRSFVSDFGVVWDEEAKEYRCVKNKFLRRHIFIDLFRFAHFAQTAKWNPEVFASWGEIMKVSWALAIDKASTKEPIEDWRAKAFCTPTGEFLGRKPGNKLTYDEQYRYGERIATRQRKTRADKITLPWEVGKKTTPETRLHDNSIQIRYGKNMRVAVDVKHQRITITTN